MGILLRRSTITGLGRAALIGLTIGAGSDASAADARPEATTEPRAGGRSGGAVVQVALQDAADKAKQEETARPQTGQAEGDLFLILPSGDRATGILLVEASGPASVRVGQAYEYRIKVTNISRNLVLEDVQVHQTTPEGFSIEGSKPEAAEGDGGETRWKIARLDPGESRLITVSALSDQEGSAAGCIRVDYKPSLCLVTRFVKPEVRLIKEAPERSDLCGLLTYRYVLTNTGSAAARGLRIRDELPKGLTTTEGRDVVAFDVGELPAGQTRELSAKINASQAGDYSSRAVAEGANDLKVTSNKPSTAVRQAKLAVEITGPDAQYINQAITYRAEVRNEGDVPALGSKLIVHVAPESRLLRMSKSAPNGIAPRREEHELTWELGTIEPGGVATVSFTTAGRARATVAHTATATSICERGGDIASAAAAVTTIETEILTIPALRVEMVDREDPIRVGGTEVYTIRVDNQGTGDDRAVKIVCRLPEELKFVEATGPVAPKVDGQAITFGPLERLGPGERATWKLHVKAEKVADVRTTIELSSEYLGDKPIREIEPTRLID